MSPPHSHQTPLHLSLSLPTILPSWLQPLHQHITLSFQPLLPHLSLSIHHSSLLLHRFTQLRWRSMHSWVDWDTSCELYLSVCFNIIMWLLGTITPGSAASPGSWPTSWPCLWSYSSPGVVLPPRIWNPWCWSESFQSESFQSPPRSHRRTWSSWRQRGRRRRWRLWAAGNNL